MHIHDPLLDGKKTAFSVSMPFELVNVVKAYAVNNKYSWSKAACKLIRLGYTYTQLLEAQKQEKKLLQEELVAEAKRIVDRDEQKKTKPKTPSKTKRKSKKKL